MNIFNHIYETCDSSTSTGLSVFGEVADFDSVQYFKRETCGGVKVKEHSPWRIHNTAKSNPENEMFPFPFLPSMPKNS